MQCKTHLLVEHRSFRNVTSFQRLIPPVMQVAELEDQGGTDRMDIHVDI